MCLLLQFSDDNINFFIFWQQAFIPLPRVNLWLVTVTAVVWDRDAVTAALAVTANCSLQNWLWLQSAHAAHSPAPTDLYNDLLSLYFLDYKFLRQNFNLFSKLEWYIDYTIDQVS